MQRSRLLRTADYAQKIRHSENINQKRGTPLIRSPPELTRADPKTDFTRSQNEHEVLRSPARLGLSRRCGLTPSNVVFASLF
jgi:hypothetical protein